jgi:glycosyltransferase involved in cell wall biosynthesis
MITALFPDLLAMGGVQTAGRQIAAALAAIARERGIPYRFLSLNDARGEHMLSVGREHFAFYGFKRDKVRLAAIALRLARQGPGLVLAAHPNLAPPARLMKLLASRLGMVVVAHGVEIWKPLSRLRRAALLGADRLLAPSRDTAKKLIVVQGADEARVSRLPWVLDPDFLELVESEERVPLPGFPRGTILLSVGRWSSTERYKGADRLIAAMPALLRSAPDLHLVLVGGGDDRPRLRDLASKLSLAERVVFLDPPPREELIAMYERCDVFALPSSGEGFGLVFLEAMALGKPVVGGAQGGATDLIADGVNGYVVERDDSERLMTVLRRLLSDDPLRRALGENGRRMVQQDFTFEHFRYGLEELLEPWL